MPCANAELVRSLYVAFRTYDLADLFDLMSPEIRILMGAALPWGGEYRGYDGVRRFLERLVLSVNARVDVADLVEAGETVVAIGRLRGHVRATGTPFDVHLVHVWTVHEGRLVGLDGHLDQAAMLAEIGNAGQPDADLTSPTACRPCVAEHGQPAVRSPRWRVRRAAALARAVGAI